MADTEVLLDFERMKELRERLGLTLAQAAEAAGFTDRQAWWRIETGKKPNITLDTLARIARTLRCSPRSLIRAEAA